MRVKRKEEVEGKGCGMKRKWRERGEKKVGEQRGE